MDIVEKFDKYLSEAKTPKKLNTKKIGKEVAGNIDMAYEIYDNIKTYFGRDLDSLSTSDISEISTVVAKELMKELREYTKK